MGTRGLSVHISLVGSSDRGTLADQANSDRSTDMKQDFDDRNSRHDLARVLHVHLSEAFP